MKKIKFIIIKSLGWINCTFQANRNVKNCFITYAGGWDGACAQVHSIISIILFAKKFNITYVHTPLQNVEHAPGQKSEWSQRWENFFSLGENEIKIEDINRKHLKFKKVKYSFLLYKKENTLYSLSNCHSFTDKFSYEYLSIIGSLRNKYFKNNKSSPEESLIICIHIRRGDVSINNSNSFRYTHNQFLVEKLKTISQLLDSNAVHYKIHIFSQGRLPDFTDFEPFNPVYYLNYDEFETFNSLVGANILLMAKSSFSYMAAILNQGIVLYEPFWHSALPGWINMQLPESFLIKSLENQRRLKFKNKFL